MKQRIEVSVPIHWRNKAYRFAEKMVAKMKSGQSEKSRLCGLHSELTPIWNDVNKQADAKVPEVAVCLALGLDPETALNWKDHADSGWDLEYNGWRIDVKSTPNPRGRRLIWPVQKDFFDEVKATAFIFVRPFPGNDIMDARYWVAGWVPKEQFANERKHVDDEMACRMNLVCGTPYMHEDNLRPMSEL